MQGGGLTHSSTVMASVEVVADIVTAFRAPGSLVPGKVEHKLGTKLLEIKFTRGV
jgi:hypothetical protein